MAKMVGQEEGRRDVPAHPLPHISLTSFINREDFVLQLGGMQAGDGGGGSGMGFLTPSRKGGAWQGPREDNSPNQARVGVPLTYWRYLG